jgi:hypothetical protein
MFALPNQRIRQKGPRFAGETAFPPVGTLYAIRFSSIALWAKFNLQD